MELIETDPPEKTKSGRPRRLRVVSLDQVHRQLLVVLKRETLQLMDQSHAGKLSQESSKNLINYLKLIKELAKPEEKNPTDPEKSEESEPENFSDLSDDELKKLAAKAKHGV